MATTISTSQRGEATAYTTQRNIDRCQNGVLWTVWWVGDTNVLRFAYSTDDGATWTETGNTTGSIIMQGTGQTIPNVSIFIDLDDYCHAVYKDQYNGYIYYRRGTPNAARTTWTWTGAYALDTGSNTNYPDVVAHRQGTGWMAHVVWADMSAVGNADGTSDYYPKAEYRSVTISSADAYTLGSVVVLGSYAYQGVTTSPGHTFPSIDFHHTGDAKTVAGGTPHLYVGWSAGGPGAGLGIRFKRAAYSAGSWTWGAEREIDAGRYISGIPRWMNCLFDGTRIIMPGMLYDGTNEDVVIHERNAADTATTTRVLIDNVTYVTRIAAATASYDSAGNVYILGYNSPTGGTAWADQRMNRFLWKRSTNGVTRTNLGGSFNHPPYASTKRGHSNYRLEYVWVNGAGSPYPVIYDGVALNQPPTQPGVFTSPTSGQVVDASLDYAHGAGSDPDGNLTGYDVEYTTNNGGAWTRWATNRAATSGTIDTSAWPDTTTARLRARSRDAEGLVSAWRDSPNFTIQHNVAPTAPTGLSPHLTARDLTVLQRLAWVFNDPDAGDVQSGYDLRYRLVGTTAWTTLSGTTANTYRDIPAGTFAVGDYEWQVRTYDSYGEVSPYSALATFTAFVMMRIGAARPSALRVGGSAVGAIYRGGDLIYWPQ